MFILDLLTFVVPSCVNCRVSHISLALFQFETLKYSSIPRADVIMFLAFKLYCTHLLSSSDHLSLGFSIVVLPLVVLPSIVVLFTVTCYVMRFQNLKRPGWCAIPNDNT